MQFTYPTFLWALLTVFIPIIIHLFNFRKYKTVYFSNVRFLQNIKRETKSKSQLRNILILISRILALIFLVLAFAKPYVPSANEKHTDKHKVVVYVDNSFSMQAEGKYGILLEQAKMTARNLTAAYPLNTQYLLLTNNLSALHQQFVNRDQFVDFVSEISPSHISRSLNEILEKMESLIQGNDSSAMQYFFISDFQKTVIEEKQLHIGNSKVYGIQLENVQKNNLFIDSLWFSTPGRYKGKYDEITVQIMNNSPDAYTSVPLNLFINDTLVNTISYSVKENSYVQVKVPFVRWHSGQNFAKVQISDFPITFDNEYYFNWDIKDKLKVLLINDGASSNYLHALYAVNDNFELIEQDYHQISYNSFSTYQLLVLNEIAAISSGMASELNKYIQNGGQVLVLLKSSEKVQSYNDWLTTFSDIRINAWKEENGSISYVDTKHPFFAESFERNDKSKFPDYQAYFPLSLKNNSIANVLFRTESGKPVFVEETVANGKIYLCALPLNPEITDFATHPLFVPLFYNIALNSHGGNVISSTINPDLVVAYKTSIPDDSPVALVSREKELSLFPKMMYQNGDLRLFPDELTVLQGSYDLDQGEKTIGGISLNYNRKESLLDFYESKTLSALFKEIGLGNYTALNTDAVEITDKIKKLNAGSDLSIRMLWLVLLFLVFEMIIVRFINK